MPFLYANVPREVITPSTGKYVYLLVMSREFVMYRIYNVVLYLHQFHFQQIKFE